MKAIILVFVILFSSCNALQYKHTIQKNLPELGTIGVFETYALQNKRNAKTVCNIKSPLRLSTTNIDVSKRRIFVKKDSLSKPGKDSTLVSLEILDKISMIGQINKNKELLKYLKKGENLRVVTSVTVNYPEDILSEFYAADETYLIQNKERTLSVELRKNGKAFKVIEFTDGNIVNFRASQFCWGSTGYKVEILDLVAVDDVCGGGTYGSARKAERKNEIRF